MPVHFHHPEAASGLPRVSFGSVFTRGDRAYAALEMESGEAEAEATRHPAPHHERRGGMERTPSAPELLSLVAAKAARAHPSAPKAWRRVDAAGEVTLLQADKHSIATRCAIPLRDLRILDVELTTSFSTALLSRERTIVINLEHVKMIVTADEALIPNAELAEAASFAEMLSARLRGQDGSSVAGASSASKAGSSASLAQPRARSAEDLVRLAEQSAAPPFAPPPAPPPHHFTPHHSHAAGAAAAVVARAIGALPHAHAHLTPPPPPPPPPPSSAGSSSLMGPRPPPSLTKPWLCISATGVHRTLLLDKHAVAQRCGVPLRDLRVLDIGLTTSFSTALLCRKRTIVMNLEHVKMLLTHQEALIPHGVLAEAASFVDELTRRLRAAAAAAAVAATRAAAAAAVEERRAAAAAESPIRTPRTPLSAHAPGGAPPGQKHEEEAPLPFEFVVLDTALEFACAGLETTVKQLEHETPAALEAMGQTIDGQTLQRVRTLKGVITRTEGRAEAVRAEIERFLNDDSDMRGMYLSRKAEARRAVTAGGGGSGGGSGLRSGAMSPALTLRRRSSGRASPSVLEGLVAWRNRSRRGARAGSAMGSGMTTPTGGATPAPRFRGGGGGNPVFGPAPALPRGGPGGLGGGGPARSGVETPMSRRDSFGSTAMSLAGLLERLDDDADVQELEDILETYFAQLDRTCSRLRALDEHVSQTEDFVNIDLDSKRNMLIEIMMVTAFVSLVILMYTTETGLFAMMLPSVADKGADVVKFRFVAMNVVSGFGVAFSSWLFVALLRRRRILHI